MTSVTSSTRERRLPPPVDSPKRLSSGNQAAEYIRQLIFDGELRPGDRVPQDDIAEVLSVSRIPVREGLIALESEGWVRIELNRGAFVNALDADAVRDGYELFGLVYGFAARRAVARAEHDFVAVLATIDAELKRTDDPDEFYRLTMQFHRTIVDAARSPRVNVVLRASAGLVTGNFFAQIPGSMKVEQRGASAIVRALRAGDTDRAADEYVTMLGRQGDLVIKVFEERGLFGTSDTAGAGRAR